MSAMRYLMPKVRTKGKKVSEKGSEVIRKGKKVSRMVWNVPDSRVLRGSSRFWLCEDLRLTATLWKDSKDVCFLSNKYTNEMVRIERGRKGECGKVNVCSPLSGRCIMRE